MFVNLINFTRVVDIKSLLSNKRKIFIYQSWFSLFTNAFFVQHRFVRKSGFQSKM